MLAGHLTSAFVPLNCLEGTMITDLLYLTKPNKLSISEDVIIGISCGKITEQSNFLSERYLSAKLIASLTPDSLSKISMVSNCLPSFNATSSFDTRTILLISLQFDTVLRTSCNIRLHIFSLHSCCKFSLFLALENVLTGIIAEVFNLGRILF